MRRSLHAARVLLTGASSGIGHELALALARRGANLLLTARREDLLRETAEACRALGATADYVAGDITDPAVRDRVIHRVEDRWGALDVLINNAGASAHGRFADSDEPTLRGVMEVNFFAPVELTRRALPLLLRAPVTLRSAERSAPPTPVAGASGWRVASTSAETSASPSENLKSKIQNPKSCPPAIVNIASVLAHRGVPFNNEYAASKFALRGWTESLRAELAADNIDVLLVSPGTVETDFFNHLLARRTALPWGKSKAIPPAAVAEQTVRALERGRSEIFPNWRGHALVLASRFFPAIVDRALKRLARPN
jgi:short-subunit dehydrogenase